MSWSTDRLTIPWTEIPLLLIPGCGSRTIDDLKQVNRTNGLAPTLTIGSCVDLIGKQIVSRPASEYDDLNICCYLPDEVAQPDHSLWITLRELIIKEDGTL